MPVDLAQLTRRLSSYQPAGAQPYSLEASFQTILEAEQRIYGICERRGIVLGEDALPLRENTLPLKVEKEILIRQKQDHLFPAYFSALGISFTGDLWQDFISSLNF